MKVQVKTGYELPNTAQKGDCLPIRYEYLSYLAGIFLIWEMGISIFSSEIINSPCSDSRLTRQLSDNLALYVASLQGEKELDKLMQWCDW